MDPAFDPALEPFWKLGRHLGFRPDIPDEAPGFLTKIRADFDGPEAELYEWLENRLLREYSSLGGRPEWIQDPQWPFSSERPMVFVGQINVDGKTPGWGGCAGSFFVFWDPLTGSREVILQSE